MYRVGDLQRVHVYGDRNNFCAEISVANLGDGELVGVLAQNRGLVHTDTGTILLVRSTDNGRTWDPASKVVVLASGSVLVTVTPVAAVDPLWNGLVNSARSKKGWPT